MIPLARGMVRRRRRAAPGGRGRGCGLGLVPRSGPDRLPDLGPRGPRRFPLGGVDRDPPPFFLARPQHRPVPVDPDRRPRSVRPFQHRGAGESAVRPGVPDRPGVLRGRPGVQRRVPADVEHLDQAEECEQCVTPGTAARRRNDRLRRRQDRPVLAGPRIRRVPDRLPERGDRELDLVREHGAGVVGRRSLQDLGDHRHRQGPFRAVEDRPPVGHVPRDPVPGIEPLVGGRPRWRLRRGLAAAGQRHTTHNDRADHRFTRARSGTRADIPLPLPKVNDVLNPVS